MNNKKKYFTTGEFAKACGVNKQRILYYDKINLLTPSYRDSNGRRYYQIYHHDLFYLIEILQDMGMSLQDIKSYLNKRTPQDYVQKLKEQRIAIKEEIDKLQYAEKLIKDQIELEESKFNISFDTMQVVKNKTMDICYSEEIRSFSSLEKSEKLDRLMEKMQIVGVNIGNSIGSLVLKENILKERFEDHSYYFVLDQPLFSDIECDRKQLTGDFLVGYHQGDYENISVTYKKMLGYMSKNNLILGDYSIEKIIYGTVHEKNPANYITKICICIQD